MTPTLTITKGAATIDLLAAPYSVGSDLDFGGVTRVWESFTAAHITNPRFGPTDYASPRSIPFDVFVTGTSADDCAASVDALLAVLPDDDTYSVVTVGGNGSSYTATAIARRVDGPVEKPYPALEQLKYRATVTFTLACDPYLKGATDTRYDAAAVTLPAVVSLAAMAGDGDAPLDQLLDFGALEVTSLFAGRYPDESATIADFAFEAVDLTWSGGAAAADAAGYPDGSGNTVWSNQSATAVYADVDVTDLEPGEYLVVAKCKATTANTATIQHSYSAATPIPRTALDLLTLGTVALPCTAVRGAATSSLRFYIAGDGTNYGYVNALFFVPLSFGGMVGWQRSSHAHTIASEGDVLYADDVGDNGYSFGGRQIVGKGGVLVMVAEQATPAPTTDVDLTLSYEPRWEQLPSYGPGVTVGEQLLALGAQQVDPTSNVGWATYGDEYDLAQFKATVYDEFAGKADATITDATVADSGGLYIVGGLGTPLISDGTYTKASADHATYVQQLLPANGRRIGAKFTLGPHTTDSGVAALMFWSEDISQTYPRIPDCVTHLVVGPDAWLLGKFVDNSLTNIGNGTFATPLATDGTEYTIEMWVDAEGGNVRVYTPDGLMHTYADALASSLDARYACWECYQPAATDSLPAFTKVWAS